MVGSSDSDSEDDKRVVRSAKDRRFDELKLTCEEMRVSSGFVPLLGECSASVARTDLICVFRLCTYFDFSVFCFGSRLPMWGPTEKDAYQ